jgi:ERCC4-related helicase
LNPDLLSVVLVDRVPLVYQHASSILKHVRLKVCRLCGETSNANLKRGIIQGHYQCVIATAGSFVELLKHPAMSIHQLSVIVFDECHHTSGNHVYGEVLRQVELTRHRPRLLGLSASPVSGKNSSQIQSELVKIKAIFLQAVVFKPPSVRRESVPIWQLVDMTKEQRQRERELQANLLDICEKIKISCCDSKAGEWFVGKSITAIQSWAQSLHSPPSDADLRSLQELGRAFELNKLLGPLYSTRDIQNFHSFDSRYLSPFLVKLEEIISGLPLTSRTLVFVEQKDSAKRLQLRLKSSFPELNPVYIFGNTGSDGMMWRDQSDILRNFNRDECLAALEF